jgi:hypothetical protein
MVKHVERMWTLGVVASLVTLLGVGLVSTPAFAATDVAISGSTYSSNDTWYLSSTYRTVTSVDGGYVSINIDVAPKLNTNQPDYLQWRLHLGPGNYTQVFGLSQDPNAWTSLGYYGPPGRQFKNVFARGTTCNNCNHNFSGNMTY